MSSILIVDDEKYLRNLYVEVFTQAGFTVFSVQDGAEGLKLALEHRPDIIFTGIMMPHLTGFQMIRDKAESPPFRDLLPSTEADRFQKHQLCFLH